MFLSFLHNLFFNPTVPMNKIRVGMSDSPNIRAGNRLVCTLVKYSTTDELQQQCNGVEVYWNTRRFRGFYSLTMRLQLLAHGDPGHVSVGSKVGSLDNASHRASGGNVKIEDRRLEWKMVGRTDARNPNYTPQGGNKKVRGTVTALSRC